MDNALKLVLYLVAVLLFLSIVNALIAPCASYYKSITTNQDATPPDLFVNKGDITCVPGPGPDAAYYTNESGQGLCGDQEYVHKLGQGYSIVDGIGEPLLSK